LKFELALDTERRTACAQVLASVRDSGRSRPPSSEFLEVFYLNEMRSRTRAEYGYSNHAELAPSAVRDQICQTLARRATAPLVAALEQVGIKTITEIADLHRLAINLRPAGSRSVLLRYAFPCWQMPPWRTLLDITRETDRYQSLEAFGTGPTCRICRFPAGSRRSIEAFLRHLDSRRHRHQNLRTFTSALRLVVDQHPTNRTFAGLSQNLIEIEHALPRPRRRARSPALG
jgi:hypothetical protein